MRLRNHYGGAFHDTSAHLDVIEPATGERLAEIPRSGAAEVNAAVAAARRAADGAWGASSTAERADLCDAIADAIQGRFEEFAVLESRNTGKPLSLARSMDIPRAIENFRFFAGAVRHTHTAMHEMRDAINYTLRRPLGVVGLITPWNLPLYLLSWKVAPALATGNAVVAKPSEITPLTAGLLADVVHALGAPAGCFNLVHGLGPDVGEPLCAHPDVDAISFTGGTATGRRVAAAASATFKKLSLELGGKNATVIFADADLDVAIPQAVRASFTNQGQICLCGSRILIEARVYDQVVRRLVDEVRSLVPGDPGDPATRFGSLTSHAHREKVEGCVARARAEGGEVLLGGKRPATRPDGAYYEPTLIQGLSIDSETATQEIFGPVVTLHPFTDEADAIRQANTGRYGLAASIWTRDLARAHRVSAALQTGMVWVNCWLKRDLRVPFGGVKDSGVGREGGDYSLSFYSADKNICIQLG